MIVDSEGVWIKGADILAQLTDDINTHRLSGQVDYVEALRDFKSRLMMAILRREVD